MKIAFVIYDLSNGGAERVVSLLSRELFKDNEVKIILFSSNIEYEYGGEIIDLNIPSVNSRFGKIVNIFKRTKELKNIFNREKFDKIFSFMESSNIASILTGNNVYISIRTNPNRFSKYFIAFIKVLYNFNNVKKIIVPSLAIKNILEKWKIRNIEVIYNPLDFESIDTLKIENINLKYKYIISVGRLEKIKNYDLLIRAFSETKAKEYVKLLILGEGKERENLEKLIEKLNLKNKVILYGKEKNVYKYLYNSEMFILSSKYEGFPNTLIEALACNVPCISTDCPTGPREIIKNGYNGLLVENENVEELAKAMDKLFFNENLTHKFKVNARKSIEHLSVEKIAKKWLEL